MADFVQIEGLERLRKRLQALSPKVLREVCPTLTSEAKDILSASLSNAPKLSGELVSSSFVDPAQVDKSGLSATSTAGFESEHAAYAHEGYHFGRKVADPPKFLERAANGRGNALAKKVADAMVAALKRLEGEG